MDGTQELVRAHGAALLELHGVTIGAQKNHGIRHARFPWILSVDADERVSPELAVAIVAMVKHPTAAAFRVHMRNRYLGKPYDYGSWARDRHVRLFPRTSRWTEQRVHEQLITEGPIGDLDGRLDHEPYRDLAHHLQKVHRYAVWGAEDLWENGKRATWVHLVLRPLWRFARAYLLEGMWRAGARGVVFCGVHAWTAFAKYALLWDHERRAGQGTARSVARQKNATGLIEDGASGLREA